MNWQVVQLFVLLSGVSGMLTYCKTRGYIPLQHRYREALAEGSIRANMGCSELEENEWRHGSFNYGKYE